MPRGPLPPLPKEAGGGVRGLLTMLDMAVRALPPQLKLPIANWIKGWAISVADEAGEQMGRPPVGENEFASHGATYDQAGRAWPRQ